MLSYQWTAGIFRAPTVMKFSARRMPCASTRNLHMHDLPPRAASTPTQFVPRLHACGGLPKCRLCLRTFYKWQNLKEHIESGACDKLGGASLT